MSRAALIAAALAAAGSAGGASALSATARATTATPAGVHLRLRCSPRPEVAARFIVPPPPFVARVVSVRRRAIPPPEPAGRGPRYKRLYLVTFRAVRGNVVLPSGHTYSQFAYVGRTTTRAPWCFLKGGSGP